jgi:aspartate aminotransferase-like enzyme
VAERLNLTIKYWAPSIAAQSGSSSGTSSKNVNPKLQIADLKNLLSGKTVLVALTHTSNILGTINDVQAIANVVHEVPGRMICVDGVAYAPHRRIDVKDLGVDFYVFSWYKVKRKQLFPSSYFSALFLACTRNVLMHRTWAI